MYSLNNLSVLQDNINAQFVNDISDIVFSVNETSLKSTIYSKSDISFILNLSYYEDASGCSKNIYSDNFTTNTINSTFSDQTTLGWVLGFRGNYNRPLSGKYYSNNTYTPMSNFNNVNPYDVSKKFNKCNITIEKNIDNISFIYDESTLDNSFGYISEGLINFELDNYLYLYVNDFQNNSNISFLSCFEKQANISSNILAKLYENINILLTVPARIYFGPTTIDRLHIKILDIFGRVVNLNNCDYSIELLVEKLYE